MAGTPVPGLTDAWARHSQDWRHPAQVVTHWMGADAVGAELLRHRARGAWWETLSRLGITLLVTREYEHLVLALGTSEGRPSVSFLPLPHPSGLAVDRRSGTVFVASTRNPNQVFDLAPVTGPANGTSAVDNAPTLAPLRARFYPGALYMHDLALVDGKLLANAVGHNAVIRLDDDGSFEPVWWPKAVDGPDGPRSEANYLQLNSIAAGESLSTSYFTASTASIGRRRPGHRNFRVDGRGVVFSAATRDVVATGLTRPHSARLHRGELWVANSGYGEVGRVVDGRYEVAWRLPGWTRGLCLVEDVAFVGTSRVIPRFRQYAPGLDVDRSICALHAVDVVSGALLGSLVWPNGNQLFAIDWLAAPLGGGLPFRRAGRGPTRTEEDFFYSFRPATNGRPDREDKR